MAQPAYPVSSVSLLIHGFIVLAHRFIIKLRQIRLRSVTYTHVIKLTSALLVVVFFVEAANILFVSSGPTSQQYLAAAAKRAATVKSVPATEISAWLAWYNEGQAYDSLAHHSANLKTVMPVWYKISSQGRLELVNSVTRQGEILKLASNNHLRVIPTIGNDFDAERISELLNDEDAQAALIAELVNLGERQGYAGWDLDWEQLYPGDRNGLAEFVQALSAALHDKGMQLSLDVPVPAMGNNKSDQDKAFDYAALSHHADEIRVMTYDYHYEESEPGAVTPLGDFEAAVELVAARIPLPKLVIGLPTYGYDWEQNTRHGSPVQYDEAMALIKEHHGTIRRDRQSSALVGRYKRDGVEHVVWFNDQQSTEDQLTIAKSYGVYKYAIWRLGGEDKAIWSVLK